jgi:hypothetical protein
MFGFKKVRPSARSGISRVAVSAVLALWCVFALASGDARAFCLDLGGECSPSATVPEGPCHDSEPAGGASSSCDSCVDILVHEDASASGGRPDQELRAPMAEPWSGFAHEALFATEGIFTAADASLIGDYSPHPFLRTAVLRI